MARTTQQQLDDCDAAIARIENGAQAWTHRNRSATQAKLQDLYAERRKLQKALAEESSGRMARRGRIFK